ncbi:MAG: hypothetical protein EZS28_016606 [Streblomastix strix]|uniref:Uncharacterized protein n=1 Tax=Streblomastix strix TaxID=222440 RepID=A0A5J4VZ79_9EUKA|nr:MAG: hypothetical protein EZS28_016606 [Streblomastix strix]
MKSPTIPEVEPQFEQQIVPIQQPFQQPFLQQVIRNETPTLSTKCRSSIFEETLIPDPSMRRWLLDIISEDEHMVKESTYFVLSENQLIRAIVYTFNVLRSQIQLNIDDKGCCGSNALDPYNREEVDALHDEKLNISDQIDAYIKQEDDALLLLKTNKSELIDAYTKTEDDELLAIRLREDDALLLLKADKTQLADYVDLTSTQIITGQKQFNSNITAATFIISGTDNFVVLLGAGGTKAISEFSCSIDDSNFLKISGLEENIINAELIQQLDQYYPFGGIRENQCITKRDGANGFVQFEDAKNEFLRLYSGVVDGQISAISLGIANGTNWKVLLANGTTEPLPELGSR